jgi:Polysaccharide lyase
MPDAPQMFPSLFTSMRRRARNLLVVVIGVGATAWPGVPALAGSTRFAGRPHRSTTRHTRPTKLKRKAAKDTAPNAAVAEPTSAAPAIGTVLFRGGGLSGWHSQSASATRVIKVADPSGTSDAALKFTAYNGDVYPKTPSKNPRAQLITSIGIVTAGVPFWESYQVYLPASFPTAKTDGSWIALGSPFYGRPFAGPPSVNMEIEDGDFRWRTNSHSQVPGQILWRMPVETKKWIRFTWYVVPATDGYVELYVNDKPVRVHYNGHTGYGANIPVIDASNYIGPWFSQLSVYMALNEFSEVTMYFKNFAIATTQAAAEQAPASIQRRLRTGSTASIRREAHP